MWSLGPGSVSLKYRFLRSSEGECAFGRRGKRLECSVLDPCVQIDYLGTLLHGYGNEQCEIKTLGWKTKSETFGYIRQIFKLLHTIGSCLSILTHAYSDL